MYGNDTFFHLSTAGQIGLAVLSTALAVSVLMICLRLSSRFGLFVKALLAALVWFLFSWLSPQVYYLYYWLIIDGLPMQWVLGWPRPAYQILQLVMFTGPTTLSAHALGLLFWVMQAGNIIQWTYERRP